MNTYISSKKEQCLKVVGYEFFSPTHLHNRKGEPMSVKSFEKTVFDATYSVVKNFNRQQLINFVTADLVDASEEWKATKDTAQQ